MNETMKIIFGLVGGLAIFIYGMNMMLSLIHIFASGREKEMSDTVHTAILLALISGILMAGIGVILSLIHI